MNHVFLFGLKVTDAITVKKCPNPNCFGQHSGRANENFLNADLFVKAFEPFDSIKEETQGPRAAGGGLIAGEKATGPKRKTFVFVNNRLEGNAVFTIAAILEVWGRPRTTNRLLGPACSRYRSVYKCP